MHSEGFDCTRTYDGCPFITGRCPPTGLKTLDTLATTHDEQERAALRQAYESTNQGTIYPALLRLEQKGWIESDWGTSENNRRARFYSITRAGRKQLVIEADLWSKTVAMMSRMLGESSS